MERSRAVRSDKKRAVAPTIEEDLFELIAHISYICSIPLKTVGESLTAESLASRDVLETISKYLRRNFRFLDSIYMGELQRSPYRNEYEEINTRRLYMRHRQPVHENLAVLAHALDCSIAAANALVLRTGIQNRDVLVNVIVRHVRNEIDDKRRRKLHKLLEYINSISQNEERTSLTNFISYIIDECIKKTRTIHQAIQEYLD